MNKEAILHIPLSQYAYANNEHSLTIRLRTAKNDIASCNLYYGDRVDQNKKIKVKALPMMCVATDDLFDYYETNVNDIYTRVCYYFEIVDNNKECFYYSERSISDNVTENRTEFFQFPYIRREDIALVPTWAKDMVMYHIFPDSFADGKKRHNGTAMHKTYSSKLTNEIDTETKLGGTLKGVMENVDYIKELGVNCIYLNPIFVAGSYHKYDTIDYFDIDPCFGTKEELKILVDKCHENGIRVLLDGVFNHCGPNFFAFSDVLEKGSASKYYDWFYHMPEPVKYQDPPSYEAFAYVKEMPKLNTSNPDLEKYLIEVGKYWIREADIDGWRLDVANEINHDFWRHFRTAIREVKPDAIMIGEIWEDAGVWLTGDQFDSTMNYRFSYLCIDFFAKGVMKASEFDAQMHKMIMRYPKEISLAQMNFLDSHDVPRFLSQCDSNRNRMLLAFFYLFMGYGVPSVFYGDEYYIEGTEESEYRARMCWGSDDAAVDKFKEWIELRNSHSAIRNGQYITIYIEDTASVYAFARRNSEETILIIVNNSDKEYALDDARKKEITKSFVEKNGENNSNAVNVYGVVLPECIEAYGYSFIQI